MNGRLAWTAALLLFAVSCGGDGVVSIVGGPPPNDAPTLTSLQTSIFTDKCAVQGCHAPPAPEQGLDLSAGSTWRSTVGVDATQLSVFKRVAPGHAVDSYLYMKLVADPRIVDEQMPFGGTLEPFEIEAVRAWIDAGALDN